MTDGESAVRANVVDVESRAIRPSIVRWARGRIVAIEPLGEGESALGYLVPGFIDAHVHIESSLLPPSEFGRVAVRHGTIAAVSDPHEIANVLGVEGVRWMLDNAGRSPFHVLFGAPSCVPATSFETCGATLGPDAVASMLDLPGVGFLSEVMNIPGALSGDPDVRAKIHAARSRGLPVDGHGPGLRGDDASRYAAAGITTDHECTSLAEAEEKLRDGMFILLREGSAARDFDALHPLLSSRPGRVMFCSDDLHPHDLARGHIDRLVARAVALGHDVFDVLRAACVVPQQHYGLSLGALRVGDPMNAALVDDLATFRVRATWLDGALVAKDGESLLPTLACAPANRFEAERVTAAQLQIPAESQSVRARVIVVEDGQLVTREAFAELSSVDGSIEPSLATDTLLLAVVNRYRVAPPAVALVRGFRLLRGALASSVAHDSHNVIAVGCDAPSLAAAINAVIDGRGGLSVARGPGEAQALALPIAGLMSDRDGDYVAERYAALDEAARSDLGSTLRAPFMTLSFMALLVIPELKLSDLGLFDGRTFSFTQVAVP